MADIGSLAFKLTASGAQATAEMDRVRRAMQDIDREAKKTGSENWIQSRIGILGGDAKSRLDEAKAFAAERYKSSTLGGAYDADSGAMSRVSRAEVESLNARRISLEGVAKTAGLAAAGINGMAIATKAFSGDMMGAADLVKQLPLGIGQTARALEGLLGTWTGISAEIEQNNMLAKAQEATAAAINNQLRTRMKLEQEHRDFLRGQQQAEQLAGLDGVVRERQKLANDEASALRQIEEESKRQKAEALKARNEASLATRSTSSEGKFNLRDSSYAAAADANAATAAQRTVIQRNYQQTVSDIDRQAEQQRAAVRARYFAENMALSAKASDERMAMLQRERDEEDRLADAKRKEEERIAKEAEDKARIARRGASDVQSVEAEIAAKVLEIQGRQSDAERVLLEDRYRRRIEAAREAGNEELAQALGKRGALDLLSVGQSNRPEQLAEQVIRGRFLQGTGESKSTKMPIIGDPQQTEYLKQMADGFARGITGRAA